MTTAEMVVENHGDNEEKEEDDACHHYLHELLWPLFKSWKTKNTGGPPLARLENPKKMLFFLLKGHFQPSLITLVQGSITHVDNWSERECGDFVPHARNRENIDNDDVDDCWY